MFHQGAEETCAEKGHPLPRGPRARWRLAQAFTDNSTKFVFFFFLKGMFGNQRSYLKFYTSRRAGLPFYVFYASVFEKYSLSKDILPLPFLAREGSVACWCGHGLGRPTLSGCVTLGTLPNLFEIICLAFNE